MVNDIGGSVTGEGSDEVPAESVARDIRQDGGDAVADANSVSTPEGGEAIVATALDTYGRLDILINNAGIIRDARFEDMTPDRLDPVIDVHVKGAFNVTRPAWSAMRTQGYGRVVNTTSASGLIGHRGQTNYRNSQGRPAGSDAGTRPRGQSPRNQGQRHRPDRGNPNARTSDGGGYTRRGVRLHRSSGFPNPHESTRPGPGVAGRRFSGSRKLPGVRRGVHRWRRPSVAVLPRSDQWSPQARPVH